MTGNSPAVRGVRLILALAACTGLFLLMMVSFVDVVGRQGFSRPLPGATELTEILLAWVVFVTLPLTTRADGHIVIDLIDTLVPAWLRPFQLAFIDLIGAAAFALIAWQVWVQADWLASYGEHTAVLRLPLSHIVYGISVFAALTAVAFLMNAALRWRPVAARTSAGTAPDPAD